MPKTRTTSETRGYKGGTKIPNILDPVYTGPDNRCWEVIAERFAPL